jgi:uncharacterized protein involved in exopolysaccharide biosynthesis
MEENSKDLSDYLDALRRRRTSIIAITTAIFIMGLIAALVWPPTYRSAATILIEEQEIPSELVRSTVTSFAQQRIQEIKQRVMTRSKLMEIIQKYDLYEGDLRRKTTEEVITTMRDAIQVEPITANILDRDGRAAMATIAFTLSFEGDDAAKVQKVTNELTTVYLAENLRTRSSAAHETFRFLAAEANRHADDINALEQRLSEFKIKHVEHLSGMDHARIRMERTQRELDNARSMLRSLQDQKAHLEEQLSLTSPYADTNQQTPEQRLRALRTQHISLLASYSEDHPDVMRIRREIAGLERTTGLVDSGEETQKQLELARRELASAEERYSAEHPDVVRLRETVARLKAHLQDNPGTPVAVANTVERSPDNPAYTTLQSQLSQINSNLNNTKLKQQELLAELDKIEAHMAELPEVERRYHALARAHENALAKFQEIKAKELQAKVAQQLEDESKGERFTLIEAAALPEEPVSPNRPAIIFLSLVLAIGGGMGYAAVRENLDTSVRGIKGVMNTVQMAPLAVIPYLANDAESSRSKRKILAMSAVVIGVIVGATLLVHLFWTPLDVLWFKALRRISHSTGIDL